MHFEPGLGGQAQPFRPTRQIEDVVGRGGLPRKLRADFENVVVCCGCEEAVPVFGARCKMVQPVPHVGKHAVNIEYHQRPHDVELRREPAYSSDSWSPV